MTGIMSAAAEHIDVLGLGCAAVDDLLYVSSFPPADTKVRAVRGPKRCGGLTGAALVAAARLGARCAYAGCLGTDEPSQHVANNFASERVDTSHAPRLPQATVVHSTIIIAKNSGTRNVFFEDEGTPHNQQDELHRWYTNLFCDREIDKVLKRSSTLHPCLYTTIFL